MWRQDEAWQTATLAEHAAQHLRSIQRLLQRQACVLAGVGCGAVVAHQLGVQLQSAGVEVTLRYDCVWTFEEAQKMQELTAPSELPSGAVHSHAEYQSPYHNCVSVTVLGRLWAAQTC